MGPVDGHGIDGIDGIAKLRAGNIIRQYYIITIWLKWFFDLHKWVLIVL